MFKDNCIFISEDDTRDKYLRLNLRFDSRFDVWEEAIGIMRRRIKGRYLDPMEKLIISDPNKDGFAAMALCCLLIETLMQFREGFPETPGGQNKEYYTDFLRNQLGNEFNRREANRFYNDIRCGILHSAQTKNDTCLTFNTNYTVMSPHNGVLMVNVERMCDKIEAYFNMYCEELKCSNNIELRKNFIHKMDDITNKWAGLDIIKYLWAEICKKNCTQINLSNGKSFSFRIEGDTLRIFTRNGLCEKRSNVNFTKGDIERALCYWPNETAIKNLYKGDYIYLILNLCGDVADDIIARDWLEIKKWKYTSENSNILGGYQLGNNHNMPLNS